MESNIILAGVGGQGILSIAYVIDNAALTQGLNFKQAEVHGMSQRGGAVQSHLRISDGAIHSDLIPEGAAHMVLSVEPVEALRYCHYLRPQGIIITSTTPYVNIPDYPDLEKVFAQIEELPLVVYVDSDRLAKAAGSGRAQNTVMIGAAAPWLPLKPEILEVFIKQLFAAKGEHVVGVNLKAFQLGLQFGLFWAECHKFRVPPRVPRKFLDKARADSVSKGSAEAWGPILAGAQREPLLTALAAHEGEISADPARAAAVIQAGEDPESIGRALQG
jgi:indolepyruvate ferredoxin oxidoreductase, beta subunit